MELDDPLKAACPRPGSGLARPGSVAAGLSAERQYRRLRREWLRRNRRLFLILACILAATVLATNALFLFLGQPWVAGLFSGFIIAFWVLVRENPLAGSRTGTSVRQERRGPRRSFVAFPGPGSPSMTSRSQAIRTSITLSLARAGCLSSIARTGAGRLPLIPRGPFPRFGGRAGRATELRTRATSFPWQPKLRTGFGAQPASSRGCSRW